MSLKNQTKTVPAPLRNSHRREATRGGVVRGMRLRSRGIPRGSFWRRQKPIDQSQRPLAVNTVGGKRQCSAGPLVNICKQTSLVDLLVWRFFVNNTAEEFLKFMSFVKHLATER